MSQKLNFLTTKTRKCAACGRILNEPGYYHPYIGLMCKECYSKNLVGYRENKNPKR